MNYQVLARKWRPQQFSDVVGQEHVIRVLNHALENNRLHHAYLFTGTRGVGKTSMARILAKCLNCQTGVSAKPCGTCKDCTEIAAGRYIDLIEVDAASRTRVEDTRELLDNVQYAPTHGRYKVYLIDEVHMLSGHSFNALLKTLEEPPPHVKFLLATTDPQKLPITVLSRCLQFHLKNLLPEKIASHLQFILQEEHVEFQLPALLPLAIAAQGSVRDGLSLLDQAIAFGGGRVEENAVRQMLGSIEQSHVVDLLDALAQHDAASLFAKIQTISEQDVDYLQLTDDVLTFFHQIALSQKVPGALGENSQHAGAITRLATSFNPEEVQLYYQIGLVAKRDLSLAPSLKAGFEMLMLRMIAFSPRSEAVAPTQKISSTVGMPSPTQIKQDSPSPVTMAPAISSEATKVCASIDMDWNTVLPQLKLTGPTQALASYSTVKSFANHHLELILEKEQAPLLNINQQNRIEAALTTHFKQKIKVSIEVGKGQVSTPAAKKHQENSEKFARNKQILESDPQIQALIQTFDATITTVSQD